MYMIIKHIQCTPEFILNIIWGIISVSVIIKATGSIPWTFLLVMTFIVKVLGSILKLICSNGYNMAAWLCLPVSFMILWYIKPYAA